MTQYTYDNNGNTLSQVTSPTDQTVYHWDSQNRMVEADVTTASGTTQTLYQYNADGIRVSQTTAGQETRYLIDTVQPYAQVLLEYRPSGLIVASYVYGNGLISQSRGGVLSSYQKDGLGSTRALTNASGVVTDRYVYDAFGRTIGQSGTTVNSYLFAGQQRDAATGLDYLRARYLSTGIGRFYGMDPFRGSYANPVTLHRFLYAAANPSNYVDPTGRQTSLAEVAFGLTIQTQLQFAFAGAGLKGIGRVAKIADQLLAPAYYIQNVGLEMIASGGRPGFVGFDVYMAGRGLEEAAYRAVSGVIVGIYVDTAVSFTLSGFGVGRALAHLDSALGLLYINNPIPPSPVNIDLDLDMFILACHDLVLSQALQDLLQDGTGNIEPKVTKITQTGQNLLYLLSLFAE